MLLTGLKFNQYDTGSKNNYLGYGTSSVTTVFEKLNSLSYFLNLNKSILLPFINNYVQHSHSHFDLGVHVPLGLSFWGYRSLFEGTHILG